MRRIGCERTKTNNANEKAADYDVSSSGSPIPLCKMANMVSDSGRQGES